MPSTLKPEASNTCYLDIVSVPHPMQCCAVYKCDISVSLTKHVCATWCYHIWGRSRWYTAIMLQDRIRYSMSLVGPQSDGTSGGIEYINISRGTRRHTLSSSTSKPFCGTLTKDELSTNRCQSLVISTALLKFVCAVKMPIPQ